MIIVDLKSKVLTGKVKKMYSVLIENNKWDIQKMNNGNAKKWFSFELCKLKCVCSYSAGS